MSLQQMFQFLPIILMLLMSFSSFSGSGNQPVFSLYPQGVLQRPRATSMAGVSPDIKFYVDSNFERTYKPYSDVYRKIEKQVESEYKQNLAHKCTNEKSYRKNRLYQVGEVVLMRVMIIISCARVFFYCCLFAIETITTVEFTCVHS